MTREVPFPAGLTVLFVLVLVHQTCSAKDSRHCAPSSCGNIHNISYPFRLRDDPENCGDQRYILSCENNKTVLYLFAGKYYVRVINYSNYKIRVVDSAVQQDNYSFIPRYFLNNYNFSSGDPYTPYYPMVQYGPCTDKWSGEFLDFSLSTEGLVFVNCEKPASSRFYFDVSTCFRKEIYSSNSSASQSKSYRYVKRGYTKATDLKDLCQIEQMSLTSWPGHYPASCTDVYNEVLYGFELSWFQANCDNFTEGGYCYISNGTSHAQCYRPGSGFFERLKETLTSYLFLILLIGFCLLVKGVLGSPCMIALLVYKWRRRHLSMYDGVEEFLQSHNNLIPIRYSYSEIRKMTKSFKDKLGEGGYATVFKGTLRSGHLVAVKMLSNSTANGQDFINEVATIGRICHVNVVQLIGFCVEGSKRSLVYEFMPNGSLNKYIFSQEGSILLNYQKMYDIALGVARGIEYLHQGCEMQILHFDIKPHNILLDENFTPKVSDFGLARLYSVDDSIVSLTAARGTLGYMAPELFYKNIGGVSYKADVYSFGMLLMEMAGRRKNFDTLAEHSSQHYFPTWVYDQIYNGKDIELKDASDEEKEIGKKMIMVALWCIQMKPRDRPSMNKVVEMLEGDVKLLEMPSKPFLSSISETSIEDEGDTSNQTWSSIQSSECSQPADS